MGKPLEDLIKKTLRFATPSQFTRIAVRSITLIGCILLSYSNIKAQTSLDIWNWRNPKLQGNSLISIAFGQNKFVAVGENGTIVTSSNGQNWNLNWWSTNSPLLGVAYGSNCFVTVGWGGTAADVTSLFRAS